MHNERALTDFCSCVLIRSLPLSVLTQQIFQLTFFALDHKHLCRVRKESFNE